jgi:hypothetical protein
MTQIPENLLELFKPQIQPYLAADRRTIIPRSQCLEYDSNWSGINWVYQKLQTELNETLKRHPTKNYVARIF